MCGMNHAFQEFIMSNSSGTKDGSAAVLDSNWVDRAYQASLHFCVFERDVNSPDTSASLARLFFRHIPKAVELDETGKQREPGQAAVLSKAIERDLMVGRDYDQWLAGFNHLKDDTRSLFAKGSQNAMNPILDRLADIGGFTRDDILTQEAAKENKGNVIPIGRRMKHDRETLAAFRSLGMDPGR